MWWTPQGERVLKGAEADLFLESLSLLMDQVELSGGDSDMFAIRVFDDLAQNARLAVLAQVGSALLREDVPKPALSSLLEATVAQIYRLIEDGVHLEINDPEPSELPTWREMILLAARETEALPPEELPAPDCDGVSEWEFLIECLRDRILWDEDWLEADRFLDADPTNAKAMKRFYGIADDYFLATAPDPTEQETVQIRRTLHDLTGRPEAEPQDSLPGVEDCFHGLLVGPCREATAESEADNHPLVRVIYTGRDGFDCTYEQWVERIKPVLTPVILTILPPPESMLHWSDQQKEQASAQGEGLADGTRIERRPDGWVVVDDTGGFLADVEEALWVQGEGDMELPPACFATPEEACHGLKRAEAIRQTVAERREEALRKLDGGDGADR